MIVRIYWDVKSIIRFCYNKLAIFFYLCVYRSWSRGNEVNISTLSSYPFPWLRRFARSLKLNIIIWCSHRIDLSLYGYHFWTHTACRISHHSSWCDPQTHQWHCFAHSVPIHQDFASRPCLKLDVPCFDGSDTHWWIFKISQFFTYHQTPEEDRVNIASAYLDGVALAWY